MIHLNELGIMELGIRGFLITRLLPREVYIALSVNDFLESKDKVKPSWLEIYDTLIGFNNANLKFRPFGYEISDLTASVNIGEEPVFENDSIKRENLTEGKYWRLVIGYDPKADSAYLLVAEKLGPPIPEEGLEGILKPAFMIG